MDFEIKIIEFLQSGRTPFFDASFQILSELGSVMGVVLICLVFLFFDRKLLFWYLFSYGFVNLIVRIIKGTVERIRPYNASNTIQIIGDRVQDFSFPSGHMACATAIAIFLAVFLFLKYKQKGVRVMVVLSCCVYVGLVGLSRMYLGKHYLTDLIAGFAISAIICVLGLLLMRFYYINKNKNNLIAKKRGKNEDKNRN